MHSLKDGQLATRSKCQTLDSRFGRYEENSKNAGFSFKELISANSKILDYDTGQPIQGQYLLMANHRCFIYVSYQGKNRISGSSKEKV